MSAQLGKNASIGLLKKAWHEIPDVVAGTALAIFSMVGAVVAYQYKKSKGLVDQKRYRLHYTVVRSDDPLAKQAPPKEE